MTTSNVRRSRLAALLLSALAATPATFAADTAVPPPAKADFLSANMDPSVSPRQDFFQYANGGWLKANPIPSSESSWGISDMVERQLYASLRKINEDAVAAHGAAGSEQRRIGDFWATAMDTAKAERLGIHPLDAQLAMIDAVKDRAGVVDAAFALRPLGVSVFFDAAVLQDEKDSEAMLVHLEQGGLGLAERDFYFNTEAGVAKIRGEYVAHMARVLVLLGAAEDDAKQRAARVMAFETDLARASRKLEDTRDPETNYHRMTPAEFTSKFTPMFDWNAHLAAWKQHPAAVVVGQPEYFGKMNQIVAQVKLTVLRDYLRLHLVDLYAPTLSKAFDDEYFRFYGQVLSGQQEPRERWKRVLDAEEGAMGMVLGRIFVKDYFSPEAKQRYIGIAEAVRTAYRERIEKLDWMGPETKAMAQRKLAAFKLKVGYPDRWKDFSTLPIGTDSFAQNMMLASKWHFDDRLAKLGKPVDRSEWDMTPQTYNAYYSTSNNEIVLPAAIFTVPGVPDAQVDDAVVYGYIAAGTIGHEITHGFDDDGRKFDAAGNLASWWTDADAKRFEEHAAVLARQFDAYEPIPGLHINGKATLGENIADFGGLLLGLDAFRKTEQYRKGESIGGLTPLQRYFLGYAMGWLNQQREEDLRLQLLSNVHAPAKWRVLGPLSNIPEFHEAFGVKPGDPMWRAESERVRIW